MIASFPISFLLSNPSLLALILTNSLPLFFVITYIYNICICSKIILYKYNLLSPYNSTGTYIWFQGYDSGIIAKEGTEKLEEPEDQTLHFLWDIVSKNHPRDYTQEVSSTWLPEQDLSNGVTSRDANMEGRGFSTLNKELHITQECRVGELVFAGGKPHTF